MSPQIPHLKHAVKLSVPQVVDNLQPIQTIARFPAISNRPDEYVTMSDAFERMRTCDVDRVPPRPEIDQEKGQLVYRLLDSPQTIQLLESIHGPRLPEKRNRVWSILNAHPNPEIPDTFDNSAQRNYLAGMETQRVLDVVFSLFAGLKIMGAHLEHANLPPPLSTVESYPDNANTELRAQFSAEGVAVTLVVSGFVSNYKKLSWYHATDDLGIIAELQDKGLYDTQEGHEVMSKGLSTVMGNIQASNIAYFAAFPVKEVVSHGRNIFSENQRDEYLSNGWFARQHWKNMQHGLVLNEEALAESMIPETIEELHLNRDGTLFFPQEADSECG